MTRPGCLFVIGLLLGGCGGSNESGELPSGGVAGGHQGGMGGGAGSGAAGSGAAGSAGAESGGAGGGLAGGSAGGSAGAESGGAGGGAAGSGATGAGGNDSGAGGGTATKKARPGHYIAMLPDDGAPQIADAVRPGVQGVQIRYRWRTLEPTKGQYNFTKLESDLDAVSSHGGVLIAMIEDKTFENKMPIPDYLSTHTQTNSAGGFTTVRWDPVVRARFEALMKALGAKFDTHAGLEGIAVQESALGLSTTQLTQTGYTPELYRDTYIGLLTTMKTALPSSQVFWYMNYFPQNQGYIASVAAAVAPLGVSMGGPDILPSSAPLQKHVYPFYDQFAGKMTLFCSAQYDSYAHVEPSSGAFYTPQEIFEFARDDLHVSYVMWNRKTWSSPTGSYNWLDALPVIAKNSVF